MKPIVFSFFLVFFTCQDADVSLEAPLEGQWILENASCYCFFEDYDFESNQLWFFPKKNMLLSKGIEGDAVSISAINKPIEYTITNKILKLPTGRRYSMDFTEDNLTLTYIDVPEIADDEITYFFRKGTADESCVNLADILKEKACTKIYAPVCGCDGITYSNACVANAIGGVKSYQEGPCE